MINHINNQTPYDLFKIMEIKKCTNDPIYFIEHYMNIQHSVHGFGLFDLYDSQRELIQTYATNKMVIASMPRQSGKTTCAAGFLSWKAMFTPDSTILVAGHNYVGAVEILRRIHFAYDNLPDFIREDIVEYNKNNITFANGSRIMAQPITGKTGRGLSLSLIYLDEFAFVNPKVAKEALDSFMPTLHTGGRCIITSTQNYDLGFGSFDKIWDDANRLHDEYGNTRPNGLGINGFKAFTI